MAPVFTNYPLHRDRNLDFPDEALSPIGPVMGNLQFAPEGFDVERMARVSALKG